MNAQAPRKQAGATLLVSMIMLVVLTLLVVFAIRSGNTNLRIAGNAQSQAEATLATQQVIEQVMEQIVAVDDLSLIGAQTVPVSTGAGTYTVNVSPMSTCLVQTAVRNDTLNPSNANDVACFASQDDDKAITATNTLTTKPSECKTQQWEIQAQVNDTATGAKVSEVQGISIRVPSVVTCL